MIVRMCIVCSWYDEKKGYCKVNKRTVNPCDACKNFHECSQDYLENSSSISQDTNGLLETNTSNLSKTPFLALVKPSFI